MNPTQILLVVVVLVLTTIMAFVGVEVFLILKEIRQSVRKSNKILDDAGIISESIAKPIAGLSDLAASLQGLVEFAKKFLGRNTSPKDDQERKKELPPVNDEPETPPHRFFLKGGRKLA